MNISTDYFWSSSRISNPPSTSPRTTCHRRYALITGCEDRASPRTEWDARADGTDDIPGMVWKVFGWESRGVARGVESGESEWMYGNHLMMNTKNYNWWILGWRYSLVFCCWLSLKWRFRSSNGEEYYKILTREFIHKNSSKIYNNYNSKRHSR